MATSTVDAMDRQIIQELRRSGRQANTEIARRVGVSETTIRKRVQRLMAKGLIRVDVAVNLSQLGYKVDVRIGVRCETGRILDVGRTLTEMQEVRYVSYVTGRYDLLIAALFITEKELLAFITTRLSVVPGIINSETLHVLGVAKRDFDYWEPVHSFLQPPNRPVDGDSHDHREIG